MVSNQSLDITNKHSANTVNIFPKHSKTNPIDHIQWDRRFLELARHISSWSKDTTKIGAVIVNNHSRDVISMGFNGFPRGIADSKERLEDRVTKYQYVVHAEMNAIHNAAREGKRLEGTFLYIWGLPICEECAKGIIQVGIKKVIVNTMEAPHHWMASCHRAAEYLHEAEVKYHKISI